jgi:hypothetical protein
MDRVAYVRLVWVAIGGAHGSQTCDKVSKSVNVSVCVARVRWRVCMTV